MTMTALSTDVAKAKRSAIALSAMDTESKNKALEAMAKALDSHRKQILDANERDISENTDLTPVMVKRLKVTDQKITGMIDGIRDVVKLSDPVGETMSSTLLDKDLTLYQVKCPIGVLGVIFESRPDVVPQIMSLCLKSGNAVIFKGGREATNSNATLFKILTAAAYKAGVPKGCFVLLQSREDVNEILSMDKYIDLLIPRGSNQFVRYIQENTKIPVMGHAAGICHVYVDEYADVKKALDVTLDAKIQYPAVCNATETLLVHEKIAEKFLPKMNELFRKNNVEVRCDSKSKKLMKGSVSATKEDWNTEYNDMIISVAIVKSIDEAIDFINEHGSHHTDAIITENKENKLHFAKMVDSADVMINASTRFADGFRFGFGAEVGISTNKIHSRGPVGMDGLMIYKYVVVGDGQKVEKYASGEKKFKHKRLKKEFEV